MTGIAECYSNLRRRGAASVKQQGSMCTDHERRILATGVTEPFVVP
jgi:hypothetical protein